MYKSLKTENKRTKYKINKKAEERIPYFHNFSTKLNLTAVSLSFIVQFLQFSTCVQTNQAGNTQRLKMLTPFCQRKQNHI